MNVYAATVKLQYNLEFKIHQSLWAVGNDTFPFFLIQ